MLRRNILIFHNAALGDFLMTWPLALALGRVFAQSRVMFITSSDKGALAEKAIGLESHDANAGWHALHGDKVELPAAPTRLLVGLQLAVIFAVERDEAFDRRLREIAGECAVVWINPKPPAGVHVLAHQVDELRSLPILQQGVEQMRHLIETRGLQSPVGKSDSVVIHPGSGAARKNWPIDGFEKFAMVLTERKMRVTFTLGEVERDQFSSTVLDRLQRVGTLNICTTTTELYSAIAAARYFVGNDSGPTHLAAMMGRKTIALFGPTSDATAWRPVGPAVTVLGFDASPQTVVDGLLQADTATQISG